MPATRSSRSNDPKLIVDLDEPAAADPGRAGAKAATLARARQSGLPVLPGFVVEASASSQHMEVGASALALRGSGGARLAVMAEPILDGEELVSRGRHLGSSLVARSSSPLEGAGVWAGAFATYVEITPEELPKAAVGCWASAFSVDALGRQRAAGVEPGTVGMAVLVQPAIQAVCGGVAGLEPDGSVVVHAVAGSPASLLQGWERGVTARLADEGWRGEEAIALIGEESLDRLRSVLGVAANHFGVNRCEWLVSDRLWLLQLTNFARPAPNVTSPRAATPAELIPVVRAMTAAPGVLGAELVWPWALAGLPRPLPIHPVGNGDLIQHAIDTSQRLTSRVWKRPIGEALSAASAALDQLRGPDAVAPIDVIRELHPPDPDEAAELMSTISEIGARLAGRGAIPDAGWTWHLSTAELREGLEGGSVQALGRVGVETWEPLIAAVVLDHGWMVQGIPAAAGIGAGLRHHITGVEDGMSHRTVVTAAKPLPNLSQRIWDAAGLVTETGSPAAHVFESARSLGVPAVCGVDIDADDDVILAIDGHSGAVAILSLGSEG